MQSNIIFILLLLFTSTVQATEYYVNSSIGSNSNLGTENQPWKTIQKAANTLIAGDAVYIMAGTYQPAEMITPLNSGTENNYINYFAYPGDEHLVILDGTNIPLTNWFSVFNITSKNYIKIYGLKIINSSFAGILIDQSTNIILENNITYQTYSSGISAWESDSITLNNNEIIRACWPTGGEQECISISGSNHVLIQNNHVHNGGSIGFGGGGEGIDLKDGCTNSVVINNLVHDIASVGIYIDAYATNQSNIYVSNNIIYNIAGVGIGTVSEEGGDLKNVIVSKNTVYNCDDRALVVHWTNKPNYLIKNIYIQHNTFYNNGEGIDIAAHANGQNINIVNNIFSQNSVYQMQNSSDDLNPLELHLRNNLFDGINPAWALFGNNYITGNTNFINASINDFNLQNISPAINQGAFLTKTINSGTGLVIEIENTGFFTDGYNLIEGNKIQIEGQTEQYEIIHIDSINNTITLNNTATWNNQDGISLLFNEGTPDVGAFEYDSSLTTLSNDVNKANIYPNPSKNILNVAEKYVDNNYKIISMVGTTIKKGVINSSKISLSNIEKGTYFIQFNNPQTNKNFILKFIKW